MSTIQQNFAVFSQALDLRAQRHQVLASNIANADTPNYKARDFSFESAMRSAMGEQGNVGLARTHAGHLGTATQNGGINLQYRRETQSAVDGNTVDMDVERAQISENAMQYQVLTQLIGDKFKSLRSAMSSTQG